MERKCEECGAVVTGSWAVVIFPDFKRGYCTLECWQKWSEKKYPKPEPEPVKEDKVKYL